VGKLVAADHDGNQARDLGNGSGEEGLEIGESCVEGSAALCERQNGKENEQGKEGGGLTGPARPSPRGEAAAPRNERKRDDHWHLQRPEGPRYAVRIVQISGAVQYLFSKRSSVFPISHEEWL
jgi:hypothetical protein